MECKSSLDRRMFVTGRFGVVGGGWPGIRGETSRV